MNDGAANRKKKPSKKKRRQNKKKGKAKEPAAFSSSDASTELAETNESPQVASKVLEQQHSDSKGQTSKCEDRSFSLVDGGSDNKLHKVAEGKALQTDASNMLSPNEQLPELKSTGVKKEADAENAGENSEEALVVQDDVKVSSGEVEATEKDPKEAGNSCSTEKDKIISEGPGQSGKREVEAVRAREEALVAQNETMVSDRAEQAKGLVTESTRSFEASGASDRNSQGKNDNKATPKGDEQLAEVVARPESKIVPESDLKDPDRQIWIVTTAALPWRTGTAVNPLMRALYLTRGRPANRVALVIPWLEQEKDRRDVLGEEHCFESSSEQEQWIRSFCRDRAKCKDEEEKLRIVFYPAKYHSGFGSIFPSCDICALIPEEQADVAILEEPEHLNWFRIPAGYLQGDKKKTTTDDQKNNDESNDQETGFLTAKEKAELGWAARFRFVVGIIHTNYSAYMHQYAVGTSFIAAPALQKLSSIVVRAYCHRVIRLSGVLPSLAKHKEVTCNVHGVRSEFLEAPNESEVGKEGADEYASIYFIGKLVWAKGFDKLLAIQDLYRKETDTYFAMDIYGHGPDATQIKRAFLGRQEAKTKERKEPRLRAGDLLAARIFKRNGSLRKELSSGDPIEDTFGEMGFDAVLGVERKEGANAEGWKVTENRENDPLLPLSIIGDLSGKAVGTGLAATGAVVGLADNIVKAGLNLTFTPTSETRSFDDNEEDNDSCSEASVPSGGSEKKRETLRKFDPPRSRYELRRTPIPARFLGVKDHVIIRDTASHKIFLNVSTTEVLCTTSAEALAMGKFVILPKHPSNEFFFQFPNCLAFESPGDCVTKIRWALEHEPAPLTAEQAHMFTWEGANERLFDSAGIDMSAENEWREREKGDRDAARFHVESAKKGQFVGRFFRGDKE